MNNIENTRKCTACKIDRPLGDYVSKAGRTTLKNCSRCRNLKAPKCIHGRRKAICRSCDGIAFCEHNKQKQYCISCAGVSICAHNKRKDRCLACGGTSICEHGKQKYLCPACGGTSICEHGKQKHVCRECDGASICLHNKRKQQCKLCDDSQKITINRMIKCSKKSDIKYKRYDANNFIDKCFIEMLMDESMQCHYCKYEMQLITFNDTLCTIERLDNSIGHIKSNCVLACRKCNYSRIGQK